MLNVQDLDILRCECFEKRTAATKQVYDKMNDDEKHEIDKLVKEYKTRGNEPEVNQWCIWSTCTLSPA